MKRILKPKYDGLKELSAMLSQRIETDKAHLKSVKQQLRDIQNE